MSLLSNIDTGDPFYDVRLVDKQVLPHGTWIVIEVCTSPGNDLYRLRLLWRRNAKRKYYKPLRLRAPVVPAEAHEIDVVVDNDWVIGVRHRQIYGLVVDTAYHAINLDDVEITTQLELITVLDILSITS